MRCRHARPTRHQVIDHFGAEVDRVGGEEVGHVDASGVTAPHHEAAQPDIGEAVQDGQGAGTVGAVALDVQGRACRGGQRPVQRAGAVDVERPLIVEGGRRRDDRAIEGC